MTLKKYKATLVEPARYSSREGRVIESDTRISATAVMHAIGYGLNVLPKEFIMTGDDAIEPDYSHLADIPFFCTDLTPVDASADDYTFRTVNYPEHGMVIQNNDYSKDVAGNSMGVPNIVNNSKSGWHRQREYIGIERGSEYVLGIWDAEDVVPDEMQFRVGIDREGVVKIERTDNIEPVSLNLFILCNVYDIDESELTGLLSHSGKVVRGNEPRLHALTNIPIDKADDFIQNKIPKFTNS